MKICSNCYFSRSCAGGDVWTECHHELPVMNDSGMGRWPQIKKDSWCRKWKKKEADNDAG